MWTPSILLVNDSMGVWNDSVKKKITANDFSKKLFSRKLWPSGRWLWLLGYMIWWEGKRKSITLQEENGNQNRKEKKKNFQSLVLNSFLRFTWALSSRTMVPETQSISNDIYRSITITWGIWSTLTLQYICQKKITYGMFRLGSKLSKSFSFFFNWNSETYLLPFGPRASS